jgi:hypothetical protein
LIEKNIKVLFTHPKYRFNYTYNSVLEYRI